MNSEIPPETTALPPDQEKEKTPSPPESLDLELSSIASNDTVEIPTELDAAVTPEEKSQEPAVAEEPSNSSEEGDVSGPPESAIPVTDPPEKTGLPSLWLWIAVAIVGVLFAGGVIIGLYFYSSPAKVESSISSEQVVEEADPHTTSKVDAGDNASSGVEPTTADITLTPDASNAETNSPPSSDQQTISNANDHDPSPSPNVLCQLSDRKLIKQVLRQCLKEFN